jgi:hypothetical protein
MKFTIKDEYIQTIATASGLCGIVTSENAKGLFQEWIETAISEKFMRDTSANSESLCALGRLIYDFLKSKNSGVLLIGSPEIEKMIPQMPELFRPALQWRNAVGTCLGHFSKAHPFLVKAHRTPNKRLWKFVF